MIALSVVVGFPAPLTGLMIRWNNLVIDVLPSFALALEPSRGAQCSYRLATHRNRCWTGPP